MKVRDSRLTLAFAVATLLTSGRLARSDDFRLSVTWPPEKGGVLASGSTHVIIWKKSDSVPPDAEVRASYSTDGERSWISIGASPADRGRLHWSLPKSPAKKCALRIETDGYSTTSEVEVAASREATDYEWVSVTSEAPYAPRDGAGALSFGGKIWLLGGWNPGDKRHFPRICNNEVWNTTDGADWNLVKPNTFLDRSFDSARDWEGRHTAGYVVHREKMWIVGGDVNQGHYHHDVWNSSDGVTWDFVNRGKPVPWGPRALHYTVAFNDKIWVIGGQTVPQIAASDEVFHRDVWNSADGLHWNKLAPIEPFWPQRGMIGGSAVFKGRIWILGGGRYDTPKIPTRSFFNDVWSSADGERWAKHLDAAPWFPRQYHDVAVFDDRLWVLEGWNGTNRNDVWYSDDGVNWYELKGVPWKPRHAASVVAHRGSLWVIAGNNMEKDVWKLRRRPGANR